MKAIIYSRVSTDAQERDGTSLDTQERACLELAAGRGWTVVSSIRDTASGFHLDRPGIEQVRGMLRRGEADVLVSYAVDRLSRNQNHIGVLFDEVEQAGAQLDFVTERFEDTAIGRFILAARAFIAEVEREKIAERTMRGKEERARSGKIPQGSARLYGYRYNPASGQREVDDLRAAVVLRVFEDFASGIAVSRLVDTLNEEGIPAAEGGLWFPVTLHRMLQNEAYAGRTIYRRTRVVKTRDARNNRWVRRVIERDETEWIEVEGATPAIIPRALFERVQARFADPGRRSRSRPSGEYPLRGRLRCLRCGAAMVGQTLMGGRYHYYRCRRAYAGPKADRCPSPYVPKSLLEDAVRSALIEVLSDPSRILAEARAATAADPVEVRRARLDEQIADVEARQRRLLRLFTNGALPDAMLEAEGRDLADQRSRLESERAALPPPNDAAFDEATVARRLPEAVRVIREWVAKADGADLTIAVNAVDGRLRASRERLEIEGSVPLIGQTDFVKLVTNSRTSA